MRTLHVYLLGAFRIIYGDTLVMIDSSARVQAFVARLVLNAGVPQPRALLAALFWPESSSRQARANLRKLVHEVRTTLPDADTFLCLSGSVVLWRAEAAYTLDVTEFESAARTAGTLPEFEHAVALYLGDLSVQHDAAWVVGERERLHHAFSALLERAIAHAEHEHEYPAALHYARRLIEHDPLLEVAYRHLMRLHALLHDQVGAVRAYKACVATLHRELGITPDAITQHMYEQLRKQSSMAVPTQQVTLAPLVGRRQEWAQLLAAWRHAATGRVHAVVLTGEAGVGKTRLAEELRDWAAWQGIGVATATCYAVESNLAYAPIGALLRSRPLPHLSPARLREVARVLPEVLDAHPGVRAPGLITEGWQRQHFFEALVHAFLATDPLLLIVDDIQWCDRESIEFLHFLLRFPTHVPLLLICTQRAEELPLDHLLMTLWAALRRDQRLVELELGPLDSNAIARLTRHIAGGAVDDHAIQQIVDESEGNPLFAIEMAHARVDGRNGSGATLLPQTVRSMIAGRLTQLSSSAQVLTGLAATIGREFTFDVLQHATGADEATVVRGLDELVQRRIIRERELDRYDFSHDKVREVAYASVSATQRQWNHRQIARALETLHRDDIDTVSGPIAAHWEQGGRAEQAVRHYERAGDAARRVYANDAAVDAYQRAIALAPPATHCRLMLKVGDVWQLVGKWPETEAIYRQALAVAEHLGDQRLQAQCANALGGLLFTQGLYPEAGTWLERARIGFEALGDREGVGNVIGRIGALHHRQGDYPRAMACLEQQLAVATATGNRREAASALEEMGRVYWDQQDLPHALEATQRALEIATELDDRPASIRALGWLAACYWLQGDYANAHSYLQQELQLASEIGARRSICDALSQLGVVHFRQGDFQPALGYMHQSLQLAIELDDQHEIAATVANMGLLYGTVGAFEQARACAAVHLQIALDTGTRLGVALAVHNIAEVLTEQGAYREAEQCFKQSIALLQLLDLPRLLCQALYYLAALYVRQERYTEAEPLVRESLDITTQLGVKRFAFKARILMIRLGVVLERRDQASAVDELETMVSTLTDAAWEAEAHTAIWRLDNALETHRQAAITLYRSLYTRTPRIEYRQFLAELGAEALPDLPALLDTPEFVTSRGIDLGAVLQQAEQFIADLARPR